MTEEESLTPPDCPKCGLPMTLRVARRGRNRGNKFWGCSDYPKCKEIVNIEGESNEGPTADQKNLFSVPKKWDDRVLRKGWYSEYTSVGSLPSFASRLYREKDSYLMRTLSQCLFLENRQRERSTDEDNNLIGSLLIKLLQRGNSPLCTVGIEKEIIEAFKLSTLVEPVDDESDISFNILDKNNLSSQLVINRLIQRDAFVLDEEFDNTNEENGLFDSPLEQKFYKEWIPSNIKPESSGKSAATWFIPQANLDTILQSNGLEGGGARRIDFLFCHPLGTFGIELDGGEHNPDIDQERDDALATCGIEILRIPNTEIEQLGGPNLESLKEKCLAILDTTDIDLTEDQKSLLNSIEESTFASKLQFAIARSVKYGWLDSKDWLIEVKGMGKTAATALKDCIQLINGLDNLYGTSISPQSVRVITEEGPFAFSLNKEMISKASVTKDENPELRIGIERKNSPFHAVIGESNADIEDIIIRPAYLPIDISVVDKYLGHRTQLIEEEESLIRSTLEVFLQNIFRKKAFRESQLDSILNILRNIDTVILLPTGAGKSFIYQLAGFLMPGITIVVDPLVALMEDQEGGLNQYGIDGVVSISRKFGRQDDLHNDLKRIQNGEFQFIFLTPERLQTPLFRNALRGLVQTSMVNLAVIDEAHCVSEWGHDFRPAYLNVSRNIRVLGMDRNGQSPPITALTGTASRAVLRDVLLDLDIDPSDDRCVIRPNSFDRSELKFYVNKAKKPGYSESTLEGTLRALSNKFNIPENEFFRPNGDQTFSGITFVPFVYANQTNKPHGILSTRTIVEKVTNTDCTVFSGGSPFGGNAVSWEKEKRENARAFKYNKIPHLVATKAFGMGIDKPNIRWTVHHGIPSSLEMFYQEAGRAGRNRKESYCGIVFTEYSVDRTNQLLDPSKTLDEVRNLNEELGNKDEERDDIRSQLYFHLEGFSGPEDELLTIKEILNARESIDLDHSFELTFGNNQKKREKALYRLTRIGVFRDYEVDYGSQKFNIDVKGFSLEDSKEQLLNYVISQQPGRGEQFKSELSNIKEENHKENALQLCEALINFTYDNIERARRRALRDVVQMARNSKNDRDIRNTILNYLTEGVGSEQIEILLQEEHVNLENWMEMINLVNTPVDAIEFKGLSMRALDGSPDHPGLLLMRSTTELLCSESDITVCVQDMYTSIQSSITRYSIEQNDWINTLSWLLNLSRVRSSDIPLVTAMAFLRATQDNLFDESVSKEIDSLLTNENNTVINSVKNVFELSSLTDNLNDTVSLISKILADEELKRMLGGRTKSKEEEDTDKDEDDK